MSVHVPEIIKPQPYRKPNYRFIASNLLQALLYARAGVKVLLCCGGTGPDAKRPLPGLKWREHATCDEGQIRRWFVQRPDGIPAIRPADHGIFFVDIDGQKGREQWNELCRLHNYVHVGPIILTPNDGMHIPFRMPSGFIVTNSIGGLLAKSQGGAIDIRGDGGFVLAPGAMNGEGLFYILLYGGFLAWRDEATPTPDWFAAILQGNASQGGVAEPPAPKPAPPRPHQAAAVRTNARREAWTEGAFKNEIDNVANCPKGGRNQLLNNAAFSLGQMVGAGFLDYGRVHAALSGAAEACGLMADDGRKQVEDTIRSGMRAGMAKPREAPADMLDDEDGELEALGRAAAAPALRALNGEVVDPETGELEAEEGELELDMEPDTDLEAQAELPAELLNPPGLVGEITRFITDSAMEPMRILALGAALSILSTATGRYWCGPTKAGQGVFIVGVAPSGAGKDHNLKSTRRILAAAGMGMLVGTTKFRSDSGLVAVVIETPLGLFPMDELGAFLRNVLSSRASSHEAGISQTLRELASVGLDLWVSPGSALSRGERIHAPQASFYGVTVNEDFFKAISGTDISNGLINRMVYLGTDVLPVEGRPKLDAHDVPTTITDGLRALWGGGNEGSRAMTIDSAAEIHHRMVPWENQEAEDAWWEFKRERRAFCAANPEPGKLFVRTAEHAIRLATIVALGENSLKPSVSLENVRWGIAIAMWSAQSMLRAASLNMADTDAQRDAKLVLRAILDFKRKRVKRIDVSQRLKMRFKSRDLNELFVTLADAGKITLTKETAAGAKRPTEWVYVGRRA